MHRLLSTSAACVLVATLAAVVPVPSRAQELSQFETDLNAKGRLFDGVGPGFRAVRLGANGNYYVLTAPAPALRIYDPTGKLVGQVPNEAAAKVKGAALIYGESFDVDRDGRVAVCDRGSNSVKIYSPDGSLATTIAVPAPESVVFLAGDEVAVASPNTYHLVTVYDLAGKVVREYGDREDIADRADVNNQMNFGQLAADEMGNTYFAFAYMPEPTVRKYDHVGYLEMEISLKTLDFQPAAQAARKALARSDSSTPALHRIISSMGVDPRTQEVWLAIGTLLMHFDKDGDRLASFRTFLPRGARIEPGTILVEPDRLVIGADPQGAYEFPKPEILPQ